ncbi:MAG: ElyC/SanA/YdcF family protein [Opitutales bacterium]
MFWLKKAVTFWLMPLQASLALLVLGAFLAASRRWATLGRRLLLTGVLLLAVTGNRQVGTWLLAPLERRYPAIPELPAGSPLPADLAACRTIVVLGGGHADDPTRPAASKLSAHSLGRIVEGVRLARLLPHAAIITTGPGEAGEPTHAAILAQAGISLGVDPTRFSLIVDARDTENEALELKRRIGDTPFALVTSAWHMPRAMALMRKAGLHPLACPTDFLTAPQGRFDWSDLLWGLEGLERSHWAIHERLGLWWAALRGRA